MLGNTAVMDVSGLVGCVNLHTVDMTSLQFVDDVSVFFNLLEFTCS